METQPIISIAKKEFLDNWRNKWIIAVAAIFLILTLVVSYFSTTAGGRTGWKDVDTTIALMMNLVTLILPIIGLMLGYGTIVGEQESGSLSLLLSYPVRRYEVIAGKFLGLSAVLALATIIGFGVSGLVIGVNVSGVHWGEYGVFILASFLVGFVYIALALLFSTLLKKRSTALGASVFLWFLFAIIWSIILLGVLSTQYTFSEISQEEWMAPTWYYLASVINPNNAFQLLVALNIGPVAADITGVLPPYYTTPLMLTVLAAWIVIPLLLAAAAFRKKDL